ncbi:MAG: adenylosuccinate synthetase [Nostoc sp. DedQUE05]|uniref:adenylosuccinate synthetase n=1 Tax=Nostoc sp. DedQUE05 TaxID=3075391 RepID=UPI002AD36C59|nr:adenylosuccinate synthetase [Nostoc sp. DedQUE05]MDZ8091095.1 adenylosuccinate synthetase [Nostoc sp. DedQUE05]
MPVTVVVGGQFGSEGKGKVAHFLTQETGASVAVRVGGSNSGHTVIDPSGTAIILQQLPTAAILPNVTCVIGAGSYIKPDILLSEIACTGLPSERLLIDPNAMIVTEHEQIEEQTSSLRQSIGSTLSGTGAAVRRRIDRDFSVCLAKNNEHLREFVKPVVPFMRNQLQAKHRIIIEGTQGFGLSLLHSAEYPYVTSRDTTAAAFVSEAGLSPLDVDQIVLVLRAFPIRVSGNSGPLPYEIDWQAVSSESGSSVPILEHTSVTKSIRRVARFHPDVVRQAIMVNRPTHIILNHLDYIDKSCCTLNALSAKALSFVEEVESFIGSPIDYCGFGPSSLLTREQAATQINLV